VNAFDAAIRQRNARLRAWAALGTPVEGRWVRIGDAMVAHLGCASCRLGDSGRFHAAPVAMAAFERAIIVKLHERGCVHLLPLLRDDPEPVLLRTRQELWRDTLKEPR
jgi:hypothetical protein